MKILERLKSLKLKKKENDSGVKNKKLKPGAKIVIITATIVVAIIASLTGYMYYTGDIYTVFKNPEELDDVTWHKWNDRKTKRSTYVNETIYDGSTDIPYVLYEIPFRTEGEGEGQELEQAYNSNKNLWKYLSTDEMHAYEDHAESFINLIFNSDYKDIAANSDAFIDDYLSYYDGIYLDDTTTDEDVGKDIEAEASALAEFYVDNEVTATVRWVTDDSLVYRSLYSYTNRGVAYVTFTSGIHENGEECTDLESVMGFTFNYGEEIPLIVNVGFTAWSENEYKIGIYEITTLEAAYEWAKNN